MAAHFHDDDLWELAKSYVDLIIFSSKFSFPRELLPRVKKIITITITITIIIIITATTTSTVIITVCFIE